MPRERGNRPQALRAREARPAGEETDLAARAAWLYYEYALTQAEISARLRLPPAKVQRLIARALRDGLVRILIEGDLAGCIMLERALTEAYGLDYCRVVPAIEDEPAQAGGAPLFSALGRAAAGFLHDSFERGRHEVVGFGHGRTLAAAVDHLPREPREALTLVSVIGGVPHKLGTTPFDVIHALAEKTAASAYLPPVPFYANSPEDRDVLLRQRGVAEAFAVARRASMFVFGIGEVAETGSLCQSGMVLPAEIAAARAAGAVAEIYGTFFDADGRQVRTELHDRLIAVDVETMRGREVLAVAGGRSKDAALRAVLRAGLVTALVTDERSAGAVLAESGSAGRTDRRGTIRRGTAG